MASRPRGAWTSWSRLYDVAKRQDTSPAGGAHDLCSDGRSHRPRRLEQHALRLPPTKLWRRSGVPERRCSAERAVPDRRPDAQADGAGLGHGDDRLTAAEVTAAKLTDSNQPVTDATEYPVKTGAIELHFRRSRAVAALLPRPKPPDSGLPADPVGHVPGHRETPIVADPGVS